MYSDRLLEKITQVKQAASDRSSAYLFRSRLKRLILSLNRSLAQECGQEQPVLPIELIIFAKASSRNKEINYHSNRLVELANTICQPSEPLDSRWKRMWHDTKEHLDALENLLRSPQPPTGNEQSCQSQL